MDTSTFPHLDPYGRALSPNEARAQRIVRRLLTPRGSDAHHPDDGEDLREWLNENLDTYALTELKAAVEAEAMKEEGMLDASVEVSFDTSTGEILIAMTINTVDGTFSTSLGITADGIQVA